MTNESKGCGELLSDDPSRGWQGSIGRTLRDSTPWWQPRTAPPPNAPNVVVILLDDLGFSDLGCYGAEIRTPAIDRMAERGLRFASYTTVPMCTPARAALLTGKNPHAVGCGWLTFNDPGLTAEMLPTLARIIGDKNVVVARPSMGGEDFSEYGRTADKIPVCMFWLGSVEPERVARFRGVFGHG